MIPGFIDSMIPRFHVIFGIFIREVGGCWLSPGIQNDEGQGWEYLTQKSSLFRTPQKAASECSRHRFFSDFGRFLDAFWSHLVAFFLEKTEMGKVCLDCAGAYGSHVRPSRKCNFLWILPVFFWCSSQGPFFYNFLGAKSAKASKMALKRVPL